MMMVKVNEKTIAYTEVLNILEHIEKEYYNKIPKNIIDFLEKNSIQYYRYYEFDGKAKMSKLTERILCYLNLEFWCDEDEKIRLMKKYEENDKELYDIQKIFDKRKHDSISTRETTTSLIVPEKNIFQKIKNRIKNLFRQ